MIDKTHIKKDLKEIFNNLNRMPTKKEYDKIGTYSTTSIKRLYGTWNRALEEIFEKCNRKTPEEIVESECKNCKNKTKNPLFCSRSCSTSYNSKAENGRKIGRARSIKFCIICSSELPPNSNRKGKCSDCKKKIKTNTGEYVYKDQITKGMILANDTQKYRRIRWWARKTAKDSGKLKSCAKCGYSTHVECAHVKPINTFDDDDKVCEINKVNNLMGLCPNHHWEFENGLLNF